MPTVTPATDDLHLIRPTDAAALLGVHAMTLRRWRSSDPTFPRPVRLGPQSIAYLATELRAWIESRRLTPSDSAEMAPRNAAGQPAARRTKRSLEHQGGAR